MNKIFLLIIALVNICYFTNVSAHSGGLNSQGCHGGSKPYHCHRSASEMVPSSSGGYRLKCSAGSRSKDCIKPPTSVPKKTKLSPQNIPPNAFISGDAWYCKAGYKRNWSNDTCEKE